MQSSIPSTASKGRLWLPKVSRPLPGRARTRRRARACSPDQCSARAAQDIWEHHRPAVGSSVHALGSVHSTSEKLNPNERFEASRAETEAAAPRGGSTAEEQAPPLRGDTPQRRRQPCRPPRARHTARPTRCEAGAIGRQMSHSLSESTRQITPPIRSGHAPPSEGSRKSSQSVHPSNVRTW